MMKTKVILHGKNLHSCCKLVAENIIELIKTKILLMNTTRMATMKSFSKTVTTT